MGNRYRCAGTTSETYINGVMTNNRVDIRSLLLPARCIVNSACFTELNEKIYIANMTDYPASESYIYTFDGETFERVVTFPLTQVQDICAFNNAVYFCDNINLFRIDGDTATAITTIPENDGKNDYRLFTLGQYMYLLENRYPIRWEEIANNKIYRFTGSGWTQVVEFSGVLQKPTCVLYRGVIHILSKCYYQDHDEQWHYFDVISNIHKTFNGVSIADSPNMPDGNWMQRNAAYVYNNNIRVFANTDSYPYSVQVMDFNGTTWTIGDIVNFDGAISEEYAITSYGYQAFTLKGKQYLFNVKGCMMMEISNPIRLSQYFVS